MRGHCSRGLACPDDELESVRVSGHNPGLERLALSRAGGGQRLAAVRHKYPAGALATLRDARRPDEPPPLPAAALPLAP